MIPPTFQILLAVKEYRAKGGFGKSAIDYMHKLYDQPRADIYAGLEREALAGFINYGTSIRWPWLTGPGFNELDRLCVERLDHSTQHIQFKPQLPSEVPDHDPE